MNVEILQEGAEAYLTSLISDAAEIAVADATSAFGELGANSFRLLKNLKRLSENVGSLPYTLFFEHFNVRDLAGHSATRHASLVRRLPGDAVLNVGVKSSQVLSWPMLEDCNVQGFRCAPHAWIFRAVLKGREVGGYV